MKLIATLLAACCLAFASARSPLAKDFHLERDFTGIHCTKDLCGEKLLLTEYVLQGLQRVVIHAALVLVLTAFWTAGMLLERKLPAKLMALGTLPATLVGSL
jgi:hypothetical protein